MSEGPRSFQLEAIRTDGWFERIGEGIGSFQALCDIIGARFFAFAMITGARIVALTVDRRNPDQTLVDFRRRLVAALLADEPSGPVPARETDLEALQLHIGVRYLLLAPLYGYSLSELRVEPEGSLIDLSHDGVAQSLRLEGFRARIRGHVREELERVTRSSGRGAVDLARIPEAEAASSRGDHVRVLELLGAWPAPLAIFLRTPDGQMLPPETRAQIAKGLSLLGSSCGLLGEVSKGEEILRLAVQYAGEGKAAAEVFVRLGHAMLLDGRAGEAIGPLRRAANLGAPGSEVWPLLARAFANRGRALAALGAVAEARVHGAAEGDLAPIEADIAARLGPTLDAWRGRVSV
jgi:hypothetical protein